MVMMAASGPMRSMSRQSTRGETRLRASRPRRKPLNITSAASNRSNAFKCNPNPSRIVAQAAEAQTEEAGEKREYQAEVSRLLDLIINSLYSNKDVFLRELVSNSSDALDKVRFRSVTDTSALAGNEDLSIKISADSENKILTIEDSGIGMTKDELVESLGTIASSGTAKFLEAMQADSGADENLIGRFGVGFYSAFLVASTVTVDSKSVDADRAWRWQSTLGNNEFEVKESPANVTRGTRITLNLKEEAEDYADSDKMCELVKTYSEFINFPIKVYAKKSEPKQVKDEDATQKAKESFEERRKAAEEKGEEFTEEEPKDVMKTEYEDVYDWRVQNDQQPIWTKSPKEVTKEEYNEFFKSTFKEFLDPLAKSHFNVEGDIEFKAILFLPAMAPFDQQDSMTSKSKSMRLYVRRVFISDQFDEDLMPRYLNFVKGVIDSNDLPLNVSREILQESRVVRVMRKRLLRKAIDMLSDLANEDDESYATFWNNFGRNIKLGIVEDQQNRESLAPLLRFYSSKSEDKLTSLDAYLSRLSDTSSSGDGDSNSSGNKIYYMAAESYEAARNAPFLEKIVGNGYEVLYLTEPIDEVAIANLGKYNDVDLVDVTKDQADVAGDEKDQEKAKEQSEKFKSLTEWLKSTLGQDKVEDVRVSSRLSTTPCVISTSQYGWSANMERIMRAQAMGDNRTMEYMKGKKVLEINPDHPIMHDLKAKVDALVSSGEDASSAEEEGELKDVKLKAEVLFETALLNSGFQLESASSFASRVFNLLSGSSGQEGSAGEANSAASVDPEVIQASKDPNDPWNS